MAGPSVTPRPKTARKRKSKPSTDKRVATELHSKIIRAVGVCEYGVNGAVPCDGPLQCAHIIRRARSAVRTELTNAFCLCQRHHAYLDSHLADLIEFTDWHYGPGHYKALQHLADNYRSNGETPAQFWAGRRAELTAKAKAMGLI